MEMHHSPPIQMANATSLLAQSTVLLRLEVGQMEAEEGLQVPYQFVTSTGTGKQAKI